MAVQSLLAINGQHRNIKQTDLTVGGIYRNVKDAFITIGGVYRRVMETEKPLPTLAELFSAMTLENVVGSNTSIGVQVKLPLDGVAYPRYIVSVCNGVMSFTKITEIYKGSGINIVNLLSWTGTGYGRTTAAGFYSSDGETVVRPTGATMALVSFRDYTEEEVDLVLSRICAEDSASFLTTGKSRQAVTLPATPYLQAPYVTVLAYGANFGIMSGEQFVTAWGNPGSVLDGTYHLGLRSVFGGSIIVLRDGGAK